jgi:hypothetical protein
MRRLILAVLLFAVPAYAQWDPSKPAASSPTRQSQEIRNNWAALAQTVAAVNLIADSELLLWAAGDAAAPTMWAWNNPSGGAVARTGRGLGDTTRKVGDFAVKITSGTAAAGDVYQDVILPANYDDGFIGLGFACGGWMLSSSASAARVCIFDKSGSSCSSYHTGNGSWQWLTATVAALDMDAIVGLQAAFDVQAPSLVAYGANMTCVFGAVPPSYAQPSAWSDFEFTVLVQGGALTTGTDNIYAHFQSPYYGIVQDVSMLAMTAGPVGAALIFDVNTWDGAAYTSMFTSGGRPRIADGATRSASAPSDSTYARRIIVPQHGTTVATGGEISVDVDQIGSGTAGRDIRLSIRGIRAVRPLRPFLLPTE